MKLRREIRDPIHGFIERTDIEQQLIDTPVFQRLRRIKQLALANLVYPGATHTRFEHSIGTMHVAAKLASTLLDDEEEVRIIRLAALLHDVGHGPFSHVSEIVLSRINKGLVNYRGDTFKIHEQITKNIILNNSHIIDFIGKYDAEKILNILDHKTSSLLSAIVTGPIDADKQDYLLRDSLYCGVKYGIFDIARLHNVVLAERGKRGIYLAIDGREGVHAVEQYVLAKYYMMTQVYMHNIRLITDCMITRGIELGILKDKLSFLKKIYSFSNNKNYIDYYLEWDDDRLVNRILNSKSKYAKRLFIRLKDRNLFKTLFHENIVFFPANIRSDLANINECQLDNIRESIEGQIAEKYKLEKEDVILFSFSIKSVRQQTGGSEGEILVVANGRPQKFEEYSTLFKSIDKAMQDRYVDVYVPMEFENAEQKKKQKLDAQEIIKAIIQNTLSEGN